LDQHAEKKAAEKFNDNQSYAAKLQLHQRLTPSLEISRFETLIMILTIAMRHGMTGSHIADLLKFVNTIVGSPSLPTSYYVFNKKISVESALVYHFVCDCNLYLGNHKSFETNFVECPNCGKQCNVKPSTLNEGTFFITLSIRKQMEELFQRAGHHVSREQRTNDENICDIQDGKLDKSLCRDGQPLSNPLAFSPTIDTDGGQVFQNSTRNSMWPVQIICNE